MGRKQKYSKEIKLLAIKQFQDGLKSMSELAIELRCSFKSIDQRIRNYKSIGASAFDNKPRNNTYSQSLKHEVIHAYLNGEGSYQDIASKYQIPSHQVVINWVKKYNRHNEIKAYDQRGMSIWRKQEK